MSTSTSLNYLLKHFEQFIHYITIDSIVLFGFKINTTGNSIFFHY